MQRPLCNQMAKTRRAAQDKPLRLLFKTLQGTVPHRQTSCWCLLPKPDLGRQNSHPFLPECTCHGAHYTEKLISSYLLPHSNRPFKTSKEVAHKRSLRGTGAWNHPSQSTEQAPPRMVQQTPSPERLQLIPAESRKCFLLQALAPCSSPHSPSPILYRLRGKRFMS